MNRVLHVLRTALLPLSLASFMVPSPQVQAAAVEDLEYGGILFDYYQQDYFAALVHYEYADSKQALNHDADDARLLKGGMTLSYGLADQAEAIFRDLLTPQVADEQRNRAWFYLAKLYYQKADIARAAHALTQIGGRIPFDITAEYNYLATLINIGNRQTAAADAGIAQLGNDSRYAPYLIYNLAIRQLKDGKTADAAQSLSKVMTLAQQSGSEELLVLADRARHALAKIAISNGDLLTAWNNLQAVRTTGLYSNRALLTYAWSAIKLKRNSDAIPALKLLDQRSIAIPETQEAKVLLAHVYETEGAKRSALKQYLLAEKEFKEGLEAITHARQVIAAQEIPQEFVINLEALLDESDWYGMQPSLDYNKLTPFLTELMASNNFYSVIKELRDLYGVRRNLEFWQMQTHEHELIIRIRRDQTGMNRLMAEANAAQKQFRFYKDGLQELKLNTLTLADWEQERFKSLWENTTKELGLVSDKMDQVAAIKEPYRLSYALEQRSKALAGQVTRELGNTNALVKSLETVMRAVITAELDKHEERIRYYWAQARLGKARLYDKALNTMDDAATGASQ
ncbi:tetratricopeptide repeat protein [Thalassolituus sp. LLYu03]|uniref:tetratricopeptide repeat protein n=1 Tax=Thalassolituus sp. LLYu03 TaxID=3421656 RepID=UPI003D2DB9BF